MADVSIMIEQLLFNFDAHSRYRASKELKLSRLSRIIDEATQ
jgi:hypothetical protein